MDLAGFESVKELQNKSSHMFIESTNKLGDGHALGRASCDRPTNLSSEDDDDDDESAEQFVVIKDDSNDQHTQQPINLNQEREYVRNYNFRDGKVDESRAISQSTYRNTRSESIEDSNCRGFKQIDHLKLTFDHNNNNNNNQRLNIGEPNPVEQNNNQSEQQSDVNVNGDVKHVTLLGVRIVALTINGKERLCLAQISNTLLKEFSYNEIHNRRVALGITCVQCTPVQLEMLRRAGAMPSSSRRCGMITMREAERLCRSFLVEEQPPELPENFYFTVAHRVNYGCKGRFVPARYISSRAKCIECFYCGEFYSPNKFIFHSHKQPDATDCNPPDSPNINSWRKHIDLDWTHEHSQEIKYAWEDVKSLFNGGTRRRATQNISVNVTAEGDSNNEPASGHKSIQNLRSTDQPINVESTDTSARKKEANCTNHNENVSRQITVRQKSNVACWPQSQRHQQSSKKYSNLSNGQTNMEQANQLVGLDKLSSFNHHQRHQSSSKRAAPVVDDYPHKRLAVDNSSHNQEDRSSMISFQATTGAQIADRRDYTTQVANPTLINDAFFSRLSNINNQLVSREGLMTDRQASKTTLLLEPNYGAHGAAASSTNFIYSQLYSQLMQPQIQHQLEKSHQQQQQLNQNRGPFDETGAQLMLRQHIWSNILANLQRNAVAANSFGNYVDSPHQILTGPTVSTSSRNNPSIQAAQFNLQLQTSNGSAEIQQLTNPNNLSLIHNRAYSQTAMSAVNDDNNPCE